MTPPRTTGRAAPAVRRSRVAPEQHLEPKRRRAPKSSIPRGRAQRTNGRPAGKNPDQHESWQSAYTWRWWLIGLIALACVVALALLRAPFFVIGNVQVTGEARTGEGAILAALSIEEGQALASFDISTAETAVAELPWVEDVQITRGWPSTLRVQIRERVVAAAVASSGTADWVVLSDDGHILERRLTPPLHVPLIVAPDAVVADVIVGDVVADLAGVIAVSQSLPAQLSPWVDSWTVDSSGSVTAELTGSARAVFGTDADHRTQYVSLASILNGGTSLICIEEIDLTIPDTPVVHRNRSCLTAAVVL